MMCGIGKMKEGVGDGKEKKGKEIERDVLVRQI